MKQTFYDFCLENGKTHLLDQWDRAGNLPHTPENTSHGSRKRVWWICDRGHRWQAVVQSRGAQDSRCPVCAGRQVEPGFNDLASRYPHLADQWDRERNGALTPDRVLPGTHRKVWWQCPQGHQWQALIKARVSGAGCPVCTSRRVEPGENDLATRYPDLAAQWDHDRNAGLTPDQVLPGSTRKVWWVCDRGHRWQAAVSARASGTGCPFCDGKQVAVGENDLASQYPGLAAQWHPEKNGPLTPAGVTANSNRGVWWTCPLGHTWKAPVSRRVQGSTGCPVCAGRQVEPGFNDLASRSPAVAAQWARDLNGSLTPEGVTAGSSRKVWWRCGEGHVWAAKIYNRTGPQQSGCPICSGRYKE